MSKYTLEQLQAAFGPNHRLVACAGTQKAHIQRKDGRDLAVIDFEQGRIETRLTVTWDEKDLAAMPDRMPDAEIIAIARQEFVEELLDDWERAGFNVPSEGAVECHTDPASKLKIPVYVVIATKAVPTIADAVETLRTIRDGFFWTTTTTWVPSART